MKTVMQIIRKFVSCLMIYLCSIIMLSTIVGAIFTWLNIKWGVSEIIISSLLSVLLTWGIFKQDVFVFDDNKELGLYIIISGVIFFVFKQYSASISIQQDQSVYITKALYLVNYGYVYKPVNLYTELNANGIIDTTGWLQGYGNFHNGMKFIDGTLYSDFYAGGAYFFAFLGAIGKRYVFWGQTLITLANSWLFYFALKKVLASDKIESIVYVLCFFLSPVGVWFGRSSSTEIIALFAFLIIFNLLLVENRYSEYIIILPIVFALTARIDYFLVGVICIFILTCRNKIAGLLCTIFCIAYAYICSVAFWVYYERITIRDMKLVKYQIPIFCVVFVLGLVFNYLIEKYDIFNKIYNSKIVKWLVSIWGLAICLLMFRDNVIPESSWSRFTEFGLNIFAYNEKIMDHLFLTIPASVLVFGLIFAVMLLKNEKINKWAVVFFYGMMFISSVFVINSSNAPQMYFLLRRYYNVFLPGAIILFAVAIQSISDNKKIRYVIAMGSLLLTLNLFADSKQKVEYAGLKTSIINFESRYDEQYDVYYPMEDKIPISPIASYCKNDIVPLQENELLEVCKYQDDMPFEKAIYMTKKPIDGLESDDIFNMNYSRMGENYEELPKEYYYNEDIFYIYDMNKVKDFLIQ